ncbi:TIGR04283 family arsenosugar biosynthesis glycosyltransferase [Flavobacteriaceae bacterium]|nr:TIGR04283 family arsenosugar biosynthesis glycosyltransferase [bacterium]MDB9912953.1 TIGR04283 family arsenosugar biosynthesis glycosyltransferase [Flavobacteriaceae bacterium]MDB9993541.1 TIGR04283 family arsenosugar biosynthesis glycosyltransferase [Flavobacteriaceae bacterium]
MNKISIIIPILNESKTIVSLLQYLIINSSSTNISEIIVVDGGSKDESFKLVSDFNLLNDKVILISSDRGRATQMNLGKQKATGTILYFLHADSFPPNGFDQLIINEVKKGNLAGCFKMKFNHHHWWLKLASWLTKFKWRACRGGDQSQYITKELFKEIGGFNEHYMIYEDNILINELYKRNKFKVIQKSIVTSARLYERKGIWTLQYHFFTIYLKRWMGASAEDIYNYYKKHIAS